MTEAPDPAAGAGADLACVVHLHSRFSDGGTGVPELIADARVAGVDAVLLTDHDTMEARRRGFEGWHDGVLLVVGLEVTPKDGHLLAFGVTEEIAHAGRTEAELCAAVTAAGGLAFPAHPWSAGSRMSKRIAPPHAWASVHSDESFTGVELWSLVTEAAEGWRHPLDAVRFMWAPEDSVTGPPPENVAAWDALCRRRRVVALGGLDAHDPMIRIRARRLVRPMPNHRYFRLLTTHVLLDDAVRGEAATDIAALLRALGEGRCYLAVEARGDPKGFAFWGEGAAGAVAMGAEATAGDWTLRVRVPAPAELRLLRDGAVVEVAARARDAAWRVSGAGVFRVEAHVEAGGRRRLWILSNPVYLRPAGG